MTVSPLRPGLVLNIEVSVVKTHRKRCPRCGLRRVLFKLTAAAWRSAVGDGELLCATCAGFRG